MAAENQGNKDALVQLQESFRKAEASIPGITESLLQGILEKVNIETD